MATLHLMVGLPCSGKTTLARRLEPELPAVRLSPDEWIEKLYGPGIEGEPLDAARDPMEAVLWELAARLLTLGVDVILDFGFWSRRERDEFRGRAARLGARTRVHFLDAPTDMLLARLAERNGCRPAGTFPIARERLLEWTRLFEPPTADEL